MASDLHSREFFGRTSLFLMGDRLVRLDHGRTRDRVRSYLYEGIESVLVWRRVRWPAAMLVALVFGIPSILFGFAGAMTRADDERNMVISAILFATAVIWAGWIFYCPAITIRFVRNGKNADLQGCFRPGKFRKFRDQLLAEIAQAQEAARAKI